MTKEREALKLALEALENASDIMDSCAQKRQDDATTAIKEALEQPEHGWTSERIAGIARLKEAQDKKLAQPEQEQLMSDQINYGMSVTQGGKRIDPMSIYKEPEHDKTDVRCECCGYMTYHREHLGCIRAAKLKEPEQEPVAWRAWVSKFPQGTGSDWVYVTKPIMKDSIHNQPLYTTPPQRTWVGLTDDEQQQAYEQWQNDGWGVFYNAIEAKLKEKNT